MSVPERVVQMAVDGPIRGACIEFAVAVDWPELRLTEEQVLANAIARAANRPEPYPDHSIFTVRVPYVLRSPNAAL